MKKILFVSHSSELTGVPLLTFSIIKNLSVKNYQINTIFPTEGETINLWKSHNFRYEIISNPEVSFTEISLLKFPYLIFKRIAFLLKLFLHIRKENYDIIYIHSAVNVIPGLAGFLLRKKIIWHINETFEAVGRNKIKGKIIGFVSDKIILASPSCQSIIPKTALKKCKLIYNAIDTELYKRAKYDESILQYFKIPNGSKIVLFVGYLSKRKGVDILVDAVKIISDKISNIYFILVGDVSNTSRDFVADTKKRIKDLQIDDKIIFAGFRNDIPAMMKICDVFILPSRNEACPISLIEAMASGKPIISTNVGCVNDLLDNGKAGIIISSESPYELSNAILDLINNKEKCIELSNYAARRAEDLFSIKKFIQSIEETIES